MPITFENDSDVIVYALEKIISFARNIQHIFVANCVWWIAGVIGLDDGLKIHINNLTSRERITRGVSSTPRDIARDTSLDLDEQALSSSANYVSDPLRRTRKGRVNPLPQTKSNLKRLGKRKPDELHYRRDQILGLPTYARRLLAISERNRIYGCTSTYSWYLSIPVTVRYIQSTLLLMMNG